MVKYIAVCRGMQGTSRRTVRPTISAERAHPSVTGQTTIATLLRRATRKRRMRRIILLSVVAPLGCSRPGAPPPSVDTRATPPTDSVVLERTRCFGSCPAYRLRVSRSGQVVFVSRNSGERAVDTVGVWVTDSIVREARRFGFFSLPDSVTPGAPLCRTNVATDHPTITIGIFGRPTKRVVYYTGCYLPSDHPVATPLRGMLQLAARIDTLTRAGRWIRPVARR